MYLLPGFIFSLDVLVDVLEGLALNEFSERLFPASELFFELFEAHEEVDGLHTYSDKFNN